MIKLESTEIQTIYLKEDPIIKVFLGEILIKDFTELIEKWLLTNENPSPYINYVWEDDKTWDDTKFWTEKTPTVYSIFRNDPNIDFREGFDETGLFKTYKLLKTDKLFK